MRFEFVHSLYVCCARWSSPPQHTNSFAMLIPILSEIGSPETLTVQISAEYCLFLTRMESEKGVSQAVGLFQLIQNVGSSVNHVDFAPLWDAAWALHKSNLHIVVRPHHTLCEISLYREFHCL